MKVRFVVFLFFMCIVICRPLTNKGPHLLSSGYSVFPFMQLKKYPIDKEELKRLGSLSGS